MKDASVDAQIIVLSGVDTISLCSALVSCSSVAKTGYTYIVINRNGRIKKLADLVIVKVGGRLETSTAIIVFRRESSKFLAPNSNCSRSCSK